jgi:hypothetical protein
MADEVETVASTSVFPGPDIEVLWEGSILYFNHIPARFSRLTGILSEDLTSSFSG